MAKVPISAVGSIGIVQDAPPHTLVPEAWSGGQNVRFQDDKVVKFSGHSTVFGTPSVAPYWALAVQVPSASYWLYMGLAKAYMVDSAGTHTNITRQTASVDVDYTGTAPNLWNGDVLGGIPVITNGVDVPQSWSPVASTQKLVNLPNWPAATTAKYIRSFKNFLVALNITESGTVKPHMIKWSHPADPGSVPSSWDDTDATKDAGERELADSQAGIIRDALRLRDLLVIYKDNSTWGMQHIGGKFIFRTAPIFTGTGILTTRCVAALPNEEQHFVMTGDDLIVHNGLQAKSVIDRLWRKFINNTINPDELAASFVVGNPSENEMWFCFPEIGATLPTLAIVWNTKTGAIGVRELSEAVFIAKGVIDEAPSAPTWNSDSGAWDDDAEAWGGREFFPQSLRLLQLDPTNTKLFKLDNTNQFNAVNMTSFVEREGLGIVGVDRSGKPRIDFTERKLLRRIWVQAEGGPFEVVVGSQEDFDGPITYQAAVTFTPGTDDYVDASVSGRLLAIKFQSSSDVAWAVHGYNLEVEPLGEI